MNDKLGKAIFWIWLALFAAGALSELLGLDALTKFADVKQLFLR